MAVERIEPGPDQESVWDYPRPPRLELTTRHLVVHFGGVRIADTRRALRLLETSHPPTYYLPVTDVARQHLRAVAKRSFCEFKGMASYFDVVIGEQRAPAAAWSYPDPASPYGALRHHVAFYPHLMDACYVDGERVAAQEGDFYGGWITRHVVGPFKGPAGTLFW